MARQVYIGEMRTRIRVKKITDTRDSDGFTVRTETDVFGEPVWCKWVFAHGNEVYENLRLGVQQAATLTMHYTDKITPMCRIWRNGETGDDKAWSVVSINHVEDARKFTEIRVKRGEAS